VAAPHIVRTREPRGERRPLAIVTDPDVLATVLEDAAHYPGGHAAGLVHAESEADVAAALATGRPVLAIGAQSSLTGGATPRGELVVDTARLHAVSLGADEVTVGAGVTLEALQHELGPLGRLYPPIPTYAGASAGGVVATDAAGPATFKYGTTRDWVLGLTVVLASGDVLDLRRGEHRAGPDGTFVIETGSSTIRVPIVPVARPAVPKCSAGYALAAGMDLVDLFVGAEGTLGIVTAATFRTVQDAPATCVALIALPTEAAAYELASILRAETLATRASGDRRGLDVSAIEHADRRAIELLREDAADREAGVALPPDTAAILFVVVDLPPRTRTADAWQAIEAALEPDGPDTPLGRFCRPLDARGLLERVEMAMPDDLARRQQLLALREAVPQAVNRRIALAQQQVSPSISKLAGDFVVPFAAMARMDAACREACRRRGLDLVVWGHVSDGNTHPNILPRRAEDVALGREALLEAGTAAIALGGSPLAEHGVGRNPLKQEFLRRLHGEGGLAAMRAVKAALDPAHRLAPGVLLPLLPAGDA
jgi:D-lactate dehydrogenase (cytochrome)